MKQDCIAKIVKQVLSEAAENDFLQISDRGTTITDYLNNAHRILNKVQTTLLLNGASESELFKRVNQCDNALIDILNGR